MNWIRNPGLEYETRILNSIFWTEHGYRRDSFFFFASSLTSIQLVTWREGIKLKSDLPHDIYFLSKGYSSIFILLSIIPFLLKFIPLINWVPFNFIWIRIHKNLKVKKKGHIAVCLMDILFIFVATPILSLRYILSELLVLPNTKLLFLLELLSLAFPLSMNLMIPSLSSSFPSSILTLNMLPLVSKR